MNYIFAELSPEHQETLITVIVACVIGLLGFWLVGIIFSGILKVLSAIIQFPFRLLGLEKEALVMDEIIYHNQQVKKITDATKGKR